MLNAQTPEIIDKLSEAISTLHTSPTPVDVLPSQRVLSEARAQLKCELPEHGAGLEDTIHHLVHELGPALNASSRSSTYFGFVTGGSTPAASLADNLVTHYDQNVQVHLPNETLATEIEDRALVLLCSLLHFTPLQWPHRTFTTGATASNILGLACGREYIIAEASAHRTDAEVSVGEHGIAEAMRLAGIDNIQILTTVPHSSLSKAASILGTMLVHLPIEPWARVCARSPPSHPLLGRAWRGGQTHGPRLPSLLPSPRQAHGPILLWAVHCDTQPRQAQPTPRANK